MGSEAVYKERLRLAAVEARRAEYAELYGPAGRGEDPPLTAATPRVFVTHMLLRITSRWEAHAACDEGVTHLISIQNPDANLDDLRPDSIAPENHLVLLFEDVDDPEHPTGPKQEHLQTLVMWLRALDPTELQGLVIHCDAGISRSTAAAWLALLLLEPETPATDHLERVAECSGQEYRWPSNLVTAHADRVLGRDGSLADILQTWKNSKQGRLWG